MPPDSGSLSGEPRPSGGPLKILGSRIDPVTFQGALATIRGFLRSDHPHHVITGNTLMVLAAQEDAELRRILESAAIVVPESSGLLWASHMLGASLQEFTPGIDLMLAVCAIAEAEGFGIFLLGSTAEAADSAGKDLVRRYPKLKWVGSHHGYFKEADESSVLQAIRDTQPSILFVGMGMPAQEKWIARHLQALGVPVVMGVGGSFDVLSGKLQRAPVWMRRWGIEWLYRLAQEPWRWRRIAQLPVFAWKVLRERTGS